MTFRGEILGCLTLSLVACSPPSGSGSDSPPGSVPGGKADTGFFSNLAVELEGTYRGELVLDAHEGQSDLSRAEAELLITQQLRFGFNELDARGLHQSFLLDRFLSVETTLQDDGIHVAYEVVGDLILPSDFYGTLGVRNGAEAVGHQVALHVPADPRNLLARAGDACIRPEDAGYSPSEIDYYTVFGTSDACRATIRVTDVGMTVTRLNQVPLTYPEYDLLVADSRLEILLIIQGNAGMSESDGNQEHYLELLRRFVQAGFVESGTVEGERGVKLVRVVGELTQVIDVLGPGQARDELYMEGDLVRDHEVVIFNAHGLPERPRIDDPQVYSPDRYQILGFYNCWGYDLYAKQGLNAKAASRPDDPWSLVDVIAGTDIGLWVDTVPNNVDLIFPLLDGAAAEHSGSGTTASWLDIVGSVNAHTSYQTNHHRQITAVGGVRGNRYQPREQGNEIALASPLGARTLAATAGGVIEMRNFYVSGNGIPQRPATPDQSNECVGFTNETPALTFTVTEHMPLARIVATIDPAEQQSGASAQSLAMMVRYPIDNRSWCIGDSAAPTFAEGLVPGVYEIFLSTQGVGEYAPARITITDDAALVAQQ